MRYKFRSRGGYAVGSECREVVQSVKKRKEAGSRTSNNEARALPNSLPFPRPYRTSFQIESRNSYPPQTLDDLSRGVGMRGASNSDELEMREPQKDCSPFLQTYLGRSRDRSRTAYLYTMPSTSMHVLIF